MVMPPGPDAEPDAEFGTTRPENSKTGITWFVYASSQVDV
jgi:hypothetical protein